MIGTLGNDKYWHIKRVTTFYQEPIAYQLLSSQSVCVIAQRNEKK